MVAEITKRGMYIFFPIKILRIPQKVRAINAKIIY